jgi:IS5 family transposase
MHRVSCQPSFLDAMIEAEGLGRNAELEAIDAVIVWAELGAVVGGLYAASEGRPSYPPLVMVKALLLQQWYGLSDPRLEFLLRDSLSMRRFVGLAASDGAPDHSTVSRFRGALRETGLDEALFARLNQQLEARGLMVKAGTILDATLVKAAVELPRKEASGAKSPREPDADWTIKNGRSHFGYKAHIGVDQSSGLIRKARLTPAKTAESLVADGLISGDERAVYADKAYEHKGRRAALKQAGIKDRIMHRSHKNQAALPPWQARRNRLIAPIRAGVERVFAVWKRWWGYDRVRYRGLERNQTQLVLVCLAYNVKKAAKLAS